MALVELREYQTVSGVPLSLEQRDALRRVAPSVAIVPTTGLEDVYDLTPGSFVGAIHVPGVDIVVRPKLPIDRVLFILSYAMGVTSWQQEAFHLEEADSLVDAIVPGFVYQLRTALRRGVVQGYRPTDDALLTVRGRIRVGDQLRRRFGIAPPAEVSFDEYTEDIELNRLLRAAVVRSSRLRLRTPEYRPVLRSIDNALAGVELVGYDPRRVPQVSYTRLTERFRPAVELARLILASSSFDLGAGKVSASAFLVDMNKAFEDFVIVALRDTLGLSPSVLVQGAAGRRLYMDEAGHIPLKPDISVWDGPRCNFVGDVKYKRIEYEGFRNADLYQMTAYAIATGLPGGILVYAAGEGEPFTHRIVNVGKEIEVFALDLSGEPAAVLRQISLLAERLAQQTGAAARATAA